MGLPRGVRRAGLLAVAVAGALAVTLDEGPPRAAARDEPVLASVLAPASGASFSRPYSRLADYLPNVRFTAEGGPPGGTASLDSVVVGRVVDVTPADGFVESGTPGTAGQAGAAVVAYDDPAADWRSHDVRVEVTEVLAGPEATELVLQLGAQGPAGAGPGADQLERELRDLGAVVVFTTALPDGPEFLGLQRVMPDPPLGIATVGAEGALAFPFTGRDGGVSSQAFLDGLDTLDELRTQARAPDRTVRLDR